MSFDGLQLGLTRRLPLILQTEAAECGLATLAMVAAYHGYRCDLASLRNRHAISLRGTTLAELVKIAAQLKLQSRPLRLELEQLRELQTPCILHWDLDHFVVLQSANRSGIVIHDPAHGRRKLKYAEASKHFTGVALELAPGIEFEKKEDKQRLQLRALVGKVVGLKRSLLQIFLLAGALEAFGIILPFFTQWIIDDALVSGDRDLLIVLAVGMLLVALIRMAMTLLRSWAVLHLSTTLGLAWVGNVFTHLLRLPVHWFEKRHLGDVVSRFGSLESIQKALTSDLIGAVLDGIMVFITLAMMLIYSPALSAIALAAVVLYAGLRVARYGVLREVSAEQLVRLPKQQSHFMESVRGIQTLKLFNREADRRERYLQLAVEATNSNLSIQKQSMAFTALNGTLVAIEHAAILYCGARLALGGGFSVGMLIAFISYKDQFITRISGLIDTLISFRMLGIQAERLADIVLTAPEEAEDHGGYLSQETVVPSIEIRNVSFRYSQAEPWVLRNVSLKIAAGESVSIAGPSGCGKTTLLKIMLGQLQPEEGEVLVGGLPIQQLGLKRYREQIGVVMQDDKLFTGSLAENIAFFDPHADQERIESTAKLAAIHNDIIKMPMGYNTLCGDMGTGLSGGQQQRVILARALYKQPRILFLDEATSHLDATIELAVNQAVKRLNMTRVIIAHRQSTLEMAERLIILPLASVQAELLSLAAMVGPKAGG